MEVSRGFFMTLSIDRENTDAVKFAPEPVVEGRLWLGHWVRSRFDVNLLQRNCYRNRSRVDVNSLQRNFNQNRSRVDANSLQRNCYQNRSRVDANSLQRNCYQNRSRVDVNSLQRNCYQNRSRVDANSLQRFRIRNGLLRRNVADVCTLPYHDDQFLLRWLRARNFDCAAAEKMLRESLKWRAEWDVDNLEEWEAPAVFEQYYPSGICGFDREGSPVIVLPFSGMDIWGMLHTVTKADLIKQTIRTVERHLALARSQASIHGHQASQLVAIIDMTDFNLRQYAWRPASELVIAMIQMYEANYPEILKACYIINGPSLGSNLASHADVIQPQEITSQMVFDGSIVQ
ncbi:hypothetical protein J6590_090463 [Homalodisca vitripennis]|nr:hypothetical protein J6590_090463 [Homalodisca vitripennis]